VADIDPFLGGKIPAALINQIIGSIIDSVDVQVFTVVGTFSWNAPANPKLIWARGMGCAGAGGGAANTGAGQSACGGGGGGGEYAESWLDGAFVSSPQTVTIGAAGAPGTAGANPGGAGGDCSFGSILLAKGGGGGNGMAATASAAAAGGAGGTGGIGQLLVPGEGGDMGRVAGGFPVDVARGGRSVLGAGAQQVNAANSSAGLNGSRYGGGGGGAMNRDTGSVGNQAGGAGAAGGIVVVSFF
jgi:hypothetical protein